MVGVPNPGFSSKDEFKFQSKIKNRKKDHGSIIYSIFKGSKPPSLTMGFIYHSFNYLSKYLSQKLIVKVGDSSKLLFVI